MAEWLGTGLQNRLQQFDSAWYLKRKLFSFLFLLYVTMPYNKKAATHIAAFCASRWTRTNDPLINSQML